jgi:hypothetical protein
VSIIVDFFQWDGWPPTLLVGAPCVLSFLAALAMWTAPDGSPWIAAPFVVVGVWGLAGLVAVLLDL